MSKILLSLVDERHRFESDLAEAEIYAIGYVTVGWAILEHQVYFHTIDLAESTGIPIPTDAVSLSLKKRLRAWRVIIRETVTDQKEQDRLLKLASQITNIQRGRNQITHGLWEWSLAKPDKLKGISLRAPYHFEEPFDLKKLIKLGDRIGEINFQLAFPGGKQQAWQELGQSVAQSGGHASREYLLTLAGKEIVNPHLPLTSPLKRKKSQSSSRKQRDV